VFTLTRIWDDGKRIAVSHWIQIQSVKDQFEWVRREKDDLQSYVQDTTLSNTELVRDVTDLDSLKAEGWLEAQALRELVLSKKNETNRERRRTERLDKELVELRSNLENSKVKAIGDQVEAHNRVRDRISWIEQQYKEQRRILEKLTAQEDVWREDLQFLSRVL